MIRVWFGAWSGNPFFLNSGSLLLEYLFPTVNLTTLSMTTIARPARRPWIGPKYEEYEDLNTHLWFISAGIYNLYPPACRHLFWMFFSCTFSSGTLRLMFLLDGVLGWLPASQPQPESSPSSATQQAASHAASQLQLASPIASHPTSSSNWASHLASQPATQSQPA